MKTTKPKPASPMKSMLRFACTACAAAIVSTQPLLAQTWQTVLDYQYPAGSAGGNSIVADASGNVFSGGDGMDATGTYHGIVLKTDTTELAKSDPSTINWYLSKDTNPDPTQYRSDVWSLGLDAVGNLYSIGQLTPNQSSRTPTSSSWYVGKSSNKGVSWDMLSPWQYQEGEWSYAHGFAADDLGNIYVVGSGQTRTTVGPGKHLTTQIYNNWLVRKSADAGQTWTLVDAVQANGPAGAGFVPDSGIFVVGPEFGNSSSPWTVRRRPDGEADIWSTVDSPFVGAASNVGSDSQGNIYVVGSERKTVTTTVIVKNKPVATTSSYNVWVTRMSNKAGKGEQGTWSTVDAFTYAPNQHSCALGVGQDSVGNVVVAGNAYDAEGKRHWIVRTPSDPTDPSKPWVTIDDFQPGNGASALGVVTDAAGNLLVTGTALNVTGPGDNHWIVRKLVPPAPPAP